MCSSYGEGRLSSANYPFFISEAHEEREQEVVWLGCMSQSSDAWSPCARWRFASCRLALTASLFGLSFLPSVLECPPPPNIANAERRHQAMEVFTPGMSVEYFCDAEYSLVAEGSIFCTAAGTWSLPLPLCEGALRCFPWSQRRRLLVLN